GGGGGGGGGELAGNPMEAGVDRGGEIEIGVGGGLAGGVLEPRCRVPGTADRADQRAAVVASPDHPVGREGVGAIALVAVDGRRRERRGAARVRQQPRQIGFANGGQRLVLRLRSEGVDSVPDERLVQVPAA